MKMYEKFISTKAKKPDQAKRFNIFFAQYEIFINALAINFFKSLHNKEEKL
jgi:hypothetical protein